MYLSIGNDLAIREANLIGIFDLDNTSTAYKTREFLSKCEENGEIVPCDELPKSFILTQEYGFNRIYLSSLNVTTLEKRIGRRAGAAVRPSNGERSSGQLSQL